MADNQTHQFTVFTSVKSYIVSFLGFCLFAFNLFQIGFPTKWVNGDIIAFMRVQLSRANQIYYNLITMLLIYASYKIRKVLEKSQMQMTTRPIVWLNQTFTLD